MAFSIKQNDTRPIFLAALKDNFGLGSEAPIDLSDPGVSVKFIMRKKGTQAEPKVVAAATIVNGEEGIVSYQWLAANTNEVGEFDAEFEITYADGGIETVPNIGYLSVTVVDDLG